MVFMMLIFPQFLKIPESTTLIIRSLKSYESYESNCHHMNSSPSALVMDEITCCFIVFHNLSLSFSFQKILLSPLTSGRLSGGRLIVVISKLDCSSFSFMTWLLIFHSFFIFLDISRFFPVSFVYSSGVICPVAARYSGL